MNCTDMRELGNGSDVTDEQAVDIAKRILSIQMYTDIDRVERTIPVADAVRLAKYVVSLQIQADAIEAMIDEDLKAGRDTDRTIPLPNP